MGLVSFDEQLTSIWRVADGAVTRLLQVACAQLGLRLKLWTLLPLFRGQVRADPTAVTAVQGLDLDTAFRQELFRAPLPPDVDTWFLLHLRAA
jgi:hypothetical protein